MLREVNWLFIIVRVARGHRNRRRTTHNEIIELLSGAPGMQFIEELR